MQEIVDEVDDDDTGKIEFNEFLEIIKNGNSNTKGTSEKQVKIYQFFKNLTAGKFKQNGKEFLFKLFISGYRRTKILDAMMGDTQLKKQEGHKILNNYKNQLALNKIREKMENGIFPSILFSIKITNVFLILGSSISMNKEDKGWRDQFFSTEPPEPEILYDILNENNDDQEENVYESDDDL